MKVPFSIKILALFCVLSAAPFLLPVIVLALFIQQPGGGELLLRLQQILHVSMQDLKIGAGILIFEAGLFLLMGFGLLFRWRLAWFLTCGLVIDGAVIPFIVLDYVPGALASLALELALVNAILCLLTLLYFFSSTIRLCYAIGSFKSWSFILLLVLAMLTQLPLFYLERLLRIGLGSY